MLQHSQTASGTREPVNINALADEYLRLAYHRFRAKDKSFTASLNTSFDQSIGNSSVVPQDIGKVLLNLFNNAFYAVHARALAEASAAADRRKSDLAFKPAVNVSTKKENGVVKISVKDNGAGIPKHAVDKIFSTFFYHQTNGPGNGIGTITFLRYHQST